MWGGCGRPWGRGSGASRGVEPRLRGGAGGPRVYEVGGVLSNALRPLWAAASTFFNPEHPEHQQFQWFTQNFPKPKTASPAQGAVRIRFGKSGISRVMT